MSLKAVILDLPEWNGI